MTALRRWYSPTGLHPGDHACWTFADAAGFAATVVPFLEEGRQRGERLLLVGESQAAMLAAVSSLPRRAELLASGQLEILAAADMYGSGRALDPVAQVRHFRGAVDAALDRGHRGLRVAADGSVLARAGSEGLRQLHIYEGLADELAGSGPPLTGMCLYDAFLGDDVLGPLTVLHPIQHHGDREPLGHLSARGPRLALHGDVDLSLADHVFPALVDLAGGAQGEVVLDLWDLDFLDVAGARMLKRAVRRLAEVGVDLRPVGPRRAVARCLELFDLLDGQVSA
ncbi:STAS domain-containing protein [Micromonospora sp. AP08]|uniref:MEDS domain-containing protein n=1 Tax=Micromonospora sp. AP08 TaxID=2604467 RepID=UPI0011D9DF55|nr:MEDS domain-containing protein [Micromonospora sp. AP08]TYB34536.1 STAS domain-containing protein [Micromonospora sp. AP08]